MHFSLAITILWLSRSMHASCLNANWCPCRSGAPPGFPYGDKVVFVANDWHAGLVPSYLAGKYRRSGVYKVGSAVFICMWHAVTAELATLRMCCCYASLLCIYASRLSMHIIWEHVDLSVPTHRFLK